MRFLVVNICLIIYLNSYVCLIAALQVESAHDLLLNSSKTVDGIFRTTGRFSSFLKHMFSTLLDFPTGDKSRLAKYIKVLSKCLREMGNKYSSKLGKALKKLSRKREEDIKYEIKQYDKDMEEKFRHRVKFLNAMDSITDGKTSILLHHYTKDLRKFGNMKKSSIVDETKTILNDVILSTILKLDSRDQRTLKIKMKNAVWEYKGWRSVSSRFYSKEYSLSSSEDTKELSTSDYSIESSSYEFPKGRWIWIEREDRPIIEV